MTQSRVCIISEDSSNLPGEHLKVTKTCPLWQPKNMVEKLNRSSCFMVFCSDAEKKKLTDIIANVKVVLYAENFSEKMTLYEKISKPKGGNRSAVR